MIRDSSLRQSVQNDEKGRRSVSVILSRSRGEPRHDTLRRKPRGDLRTANIYRYGGFLLRSAAKNLFPQMPAKAVKKKLPQGLERKILSCAAWSSSTRRR